MKKEILGGANVEGLPLSPAVKFGDLVFVSGTVGFDETDKIVVGGVAAETRQIFQSIEKVLAEAGCDLTDIIKVNVVLSDPKDFDAFNAAYREIFVEDPPARVTVAGTLTIDAAVEIDVVAGVRRRSGGV